MAERKTGAAAAKKAAAAPAEANGKLSRSHFAGSNGTQAQAAAVDPDADRRLREDDVMGAFRIIESMVGRDAIPGCVRRRLDEEGSTPTAKPA